MLPNGYATIDYVMTINANRWRGYEPGELIIHGIGTIGIIGTQECESYFRVREMHPHYLKLWDVPMREWPEDLPALFGTFRPTWTLRGE